MPTYEYECTRCGLVTEEFKPVSAPRRQRCPACRGKVERLIKLHERTSQLLFEVQSEIRRLQSEIGAGRV